MRKVRTSLLIYVALLFTAASIALVLLVNDQMRSQALWEAEEKARIILDRNLAIHTYFTHQLKPNVFKLADRVMVSGYFDPVWMSSTYAVREIDKYLNSLSDRDYYYKECAINARSPQNEADEYEKKIILAMNANPDLQTHQAVRELKGSPFLVVLRRGEVMEKACLRCHSEPERAPKGLLAKYGDKRSFHRRDGELVSAISIRIPLSAAYGEASRFTWRLSAMLLVLLAVIVGFLFLISQRLFLRPLETIQAQAERIGGDPERLGEHIAIDHYQDWNRMAQAFNDMSDRLQSFHENLEERVKQRTSELEAATKKLEEEVAQRERAEQTLQENEERYRGLFEGINSGVAVYEVVDDGKDFIFKDFNRAGEEIDQELRERLIGKSIFDVRPGVEQFGLIEVFRRVWQTGEAEHHPVTMYRDGTLSGWYKNYVYKLPTGEIVAVFEDITERKAMEEALKASEAFLKAVGKMAKVGGWELDAQTKEVKWTEETYQIHEVPLGAKVPLVDAISFFHPEDQPRLRQAIQEALDRGVPYDLEIRFTSAKGKHLWTRTICKPIVSDGQVVKLLGTFQDISERKQAEQAILEGKAQLELAVKASNVGLWDWDLKTDKVYYSPEWKRQIGYEEDGISDDYHEWESRVHPEDLDRALNTVRSFIEKPYPEYENVFRFRHRDGSYRWILTRASLLYDDEKKPVRMLGLHLDITERKLSEEALSESEERFRLLFQQAPLGYQSLDAEGCFVDVNQAWIDILGYSRDEVIGRWFGDFIAPHEREAFKERFLRFIATGMVHTDVQMINRGGSVITVHIDGGVGRDEQGQFKHTHCILQDITELKRAEEERSKLEEQIRRMQKLEAIGTLAGGIAHDFNNILSAQLGYTELALEDARGNQRLEQSLQMALLAIKRARELVKQILSFSRPTDQEFRPIRVNLVVREALDLLRATVPTTIEIVQELQEEPQTIMGDAGQIHQVIMNLCTNAAHAMREKGGVLTVKLDSVWLNEDTLVGLESLEPGRYQRLTVQDTGHGMDKKTLERIFDPFFSTKEEGEGTGLGLSMVYGIVQSHGGTIRVYSELGTGTVINVYLPVIEYKDEELADQYLQGPLPTGHERVLLVDDEEMLVDVETQILQRLGYKVTGCTKSPEALELLEASPEEYDILVTDFTMPKMTGDLLAQKALSIKPGLPIIICTGYSERIDRQRSRELGIGRFLTKPVEERELAEAIRSLLDEAQTESRSIVDGEPDLSHEKVTLLVTDDEQAIFDSLKRTLRSTSLELFHAGNGEEAIEIYRKRKDEIDVILMDLTMPGMGGAKAANRILEINPKATILIMSGYGNGDHVPDYLDERIAGFLNKPFSSKELLRLIGRVMSQKRKVQEQEED